MKIQRVRITKASNQAWYWRDVGCEYFIDPRPWNDHVKVIQVGRYDNTPSRKYLDLADYEVLEEFDGEVIDHHEISIKRT